MIAVDGREEMIELRFEQLITRNTCERRDGGSRARLDVDRRRQEIEMNSSGGADDRAGTCRRAAHEALFEPDRQATIAAGKLEVRDRGVFNVDLEIAPAAAR